MCVFKAIAAARLIVVIAVAVAMTMTIVVLVMFVMLVISVSIAAITAIVMVAMLFAVARCIFISVPAILDKQDALTARIIFAAVFRPVLGMAWRYAQIDRPLLDVTHRPLNDNRLRVDDGGLREAANVDLAVEAGLTDID